MSLNFNINYRSILPTIFLFLCKKPRVFLFFFSSKLFLEFFFFLEIKKEILLLSINSGALEYCEPFLPKETALLEFSCLFST